MLDALRSLVDKLTDGADERGLDGDDLRLAAAVLLWRAAAIDGKVTPEERSLLRGRLQARFDIDETAADALVAEAADAEREAVDLYRFTSLLDRKLDLEGRLRVIETMWEIVHADGKVGEFEENLIWRVADLLHVPRHERIALRQRVAGRA